jgi:competence protein ComEC
MMSQPKKAARLATRNLLALVLFVASVLLAGPARADNTYKVHNIDVGQGSATLVQTVGGKNILFDTGWDFAGDRLTAYLKKIGVKKLDALVISHRHLDHIGGVQKLSKKIPINKIINP